MKVYLETSAAIKLYKKELGTRSVERVVKDLIEGRIEACTSQLTVNEILRGLSKEGLSVNELDEIEKDFRGYEKRGLKFIPVTDEILRESAKLIKTNKLYVADAIHFVSAMKYADVLITEDEHLMKPSLKKDVKLKIITSAQY